MRLELYDEEQRLVERDWEYDLKEKDKQIESLKEELKLRPVSKPTDSQPVATQEKVEKPSDFEPDIHEACLKGKLSSVRFLISEQHENIEKNKYISI